MRIAVDFDATLVDDGHGYDDLETPLRLLPGARDALTALRRAGHVLLLWSGRANRALRIDPMLDPLVRAGVVRVDPELWARKRPLHEARYQQMLRFIAEELPDVFHAVDDGMQGKPGADVFLDDRALRYGGGFGAVTWIEVARMYGR